MLQGCHFALPWTWLLYHHQTAVALILLPASKVYNKDTGGYWGEGRADVDEGYSDQKFILPLQDCIRFMYCKIILVLGDTDCYKHMVVEFSCYVMHGFKYPF